MADRRYGRHRERRRICQDPASPSGFVGRAAVALTVSCGGRTVLLREDAFATALLPRHPNHPALGVQARTVPNVKLCGVLPRRSAELVPQTKSRFPGTASTLGQNCLTASTTRNASGGSPKFVMSPVRIADSGRSLGPPEGDRPRTGKRRGAPAARGSAPPHSGPPPGSARGVVRHGWPSQLRRTKRVGPAHDGAQGHVDVAEADEPHDRVLTGAVSARNGRRGRATSPVR